VCVTRIVLRDSCDEVREVPLDHPGLVDGWWKVELRDHSIWRWTNGQGVLQLPVISGPAVLEIRATSAGMAYPHVAQAAA
jgi:hypothetical protein